MKTLTRIKGMKFISLLMALAMVFVLVGCGSSGNAYITDLEDAIEEKCGILQKS